MRGKMKKKVPEVILRDGKPAAVILDIDEYREMLERLEDMEDLRTLQDFLKERHPSV
jgi:PHD/YefM family antitoxin component YafN of YafNO toxin-antitoxin module